MNPNRKKPQKEHLVNKDIHHSRMFVINANGEKLGILSKYDAIKIAADQRLDLVIISGDSNQPVARILDYGKFKYNRSKKQKETKSKQSVVSNREVRLTAMIGDHDLSTKAKKAREFLLDGDRVKVSLKFRGREITRQELGYEKLRLFFEKVADVATIQKAAALNGRFLDMYLVAQTATKQKPKKEESHAENENQKSSKETD